MKPLPLLAVVLLLMPGVIDASVKESELLGKTQEQKLKALRDNLNLLKKQGSERKALDEDIEISEKEETSLEDLVEKLKKSENKDQSLGEVKIPEAPNAKSSDVNAVGRHDDSGDVIDSIIIIAISLVDDIKKKCQIDVDPIFTQYSPATLDEVNKANVEVLNAGKQLNSTVSAGPGFADDLEKFVESNGYSDNQVCDKIDSTFANMEKTLSSVGHTLFCAEARLIIQRLKMALWGGTGFANSYMCNQVFVDLARMMLADDAEKLLKAVEADDALVKNLTKSLVEDITCYQIELENFYRVIPTSPFTASTPLQAAALMHGVVIDYGVLLLYHELVISLEGQVIKSLVPSKSDNDVEEDEKQLTEEAEKETESLTNQLQKLLERLKKTSEKKKQAQDAMKDRLHKSLPIDIRDKLAINKAFYRGREKN